MSETRKARRRAALSDALHAAAERIRSSSGLGADIESLLALPPPIRLSASEKACTSGADVLLEVAVRLALR